MIDEKLTFDIEELYENNLFEVDSHEFRYELQYIFIPQLVDAINNGELDSSYFHKVEDWSIWDEYTCEKGCDVEMLDVCNNYKLILYTFPEPDEIPEALYGAVLLNRTTNKAEYYTLECGWKGAWFLGSMTLECHRNYGNLQSREREDFVKWVTDRIKK